MFCLAWEPIVNGEFCRPSPEMNGRERERECGCVCGRDEPSTEKVWSQQTALQHSGSRHN